jgi:hypothetical protein
MLKGEAMNFLQIYITDFSGEAQIDEARTKDGTSANGCGDINNLISCTAINMQALGTIESAYPVYGCHFFASAR